MHLGAEIRHVPRAQNSLVDKIASGAWASLLCLRGMIFRIVDVVGFCSVLYFVAFGCTAVFLLFNIFFVIQ